MLPAPRLTAVSIASALAVLALLVGACRTSPPVAPAPQPGKTAPASRCVDPSAMKALKTLLCPCGEEAAFTARCERGSARDCSALGACAGTRICGHAADPERYLRYSKRGCELGDATACTNLGDAYRKGVGGAVAPALAEAAFARALQAQRPACEAGDGGACYMVAHAYRDGLGVAADAGEARRFSEKSCALGDLFACVVIAASDAEAGHHERAIEPMATVCERHCLCEPVLAARRRGSLAAARALAGWKARCVQGDEVACDTARRVEATPAGLLPRARFTGNAALSTDALEAAVGIDKVDGPLAEGASREDVLERDVLVLDALYYDHGYVDVRVSPPVVSPAPDGAHLDVTFAVEEGPRYRIGKLTIAERDQAGRPVPALGGRDLRSLLSARDGDWFSRAVMVHDLDAISTLYRDAGYAAAEAIPQTRQDRARAVVDIDVPVRRGPLVRVETIAVLGNARVTTEAIRKEIGMIEGQLFNETQLVEAKRRLQARGVFRRVDVSTATGSDVAHWKVNFEVDEKER